MNNEQVSSKEIDISDARNASGISFQKRLSSLTSGDFFKGFKDSFVSALWLAPLYTLALMPIDYVVNKFKFPFKDTIQRIYSSLIWPVAFFITNAIGKSINSFDTNEIEPSVKGVIENAYVSSAKSVGIVESDEQLVNNLEEASQTELAGVVRRNIQKLYLADGAAGSFQYINDDKVNEQQGFLSRLLKGETLEHDVFLSLRLINRLLFSSNSSSVSHEVNLGGSKVAVDFSSVSSKSHKNIVAKLYAKFSDCKAGHSFPPDEIAKLAIKLLLAEFEKSIGDGRKLNSNDFENILQTLESISSNKNDLGLAG